MPASVDPGFRVAPSGATPPEDARYIVTLSAPFSPFAGEMTRYIAPVNGYVGDAAEPVKARKTVEK
jgi:hypothetical protein